jgi:hypothetical protein
LVNVGETTKPKPKQLINYALHQKMLMVVAYLRRGLLNRGRFGYRGQGSADGERLTVQFVRAGLAVVIPYRASLFDGECIR